MGAKYQEGCVTRAKRKRGPDVWEFRWRENGKQRCSVLGTVKKLRNLSEAKKKADHLRLKVNRFAEMPARVTFGLVAEHYKANELGEDSENKAFSTKQTNLGYINNWILPAWKEQDLEALKAIEVEHWLGTLKELEPGSRAKIRNIMSAIYSHAKRYGWITHNPIEAVRQTAKRTRQPGVLSLVEVSALLAALTPRERIMVLLAVCCGLRRSELFALQWGDFDYENGCADIQRSIVSQVEGVCKTEVSRKPVPLDEYIVAELKNWQAQSVYREPSDWLFASAIHKGKLPLWPATIMRYYIVPAAKTVGIQITKGWGWHTFRHTYGTILKSNNEDVKTVQELMRHANSRITLDVYVQAMSEGKKKAQSKMVRQLLHGVTSGSASEAVN